jgi:hypothetical protein
MQFAYFVCYFVFLHSLALFPSPTMRNQMYYMLWASASVHEASVQRPHQYLSPFTIPNASSSSTRALALAEKRAGWEYGPSIAGNTAFYPAGSLGGPVAKEMADRFSDFQDTVYANVINDSRIAAASIVAVRDPSTPSVQSSQLTDARRTG